jgi:hypothetical protein
MTLAEAKTLLQSRGWSIHDQKQHTWFSATPNPRGPAVLNFYADDKQRPIYTKVVWLDVLGNVYREYFENLESAIAFTLDPDAITTAEKAP